MEDDYRLVAARRLSWNVEAWREPARLALVISGLQGFLADHPEKSVLRAEAENLLKKLRLAGKEPALRNTTAH